MNKTRMLCVGGSHGGTYAEFQNVSHGQMYQLTPKFPPMPSLPNMPEVEVPAFERYMAHRIDYGNSNVDHIAVLEGNTLQWALHQLMFAYATARE